MVDKRSLSRLDLNLLVALDALLTERSVTRAAERLQLSQPALSAALSRLRQHFADPILARRGNSYDLTPLAVRLAEHTTAALEMAQRVFSSQADWSPEHAVREFAIYGSDYGFATTGRAVSRLVIDRAPSITFRFMLHTTQVVEDVEERLRTTDGIILPHGPISGLPYLDLWKDSWVILASSDNPDTQRGLTMSTIATSPWVFTYQSRTAFTSAGRQIQQLGIEPRIEAIVESFVTLPTFIAGTRRLGLLQAGLADLALAMGGVEVFDPPFDATPITNALWWHPGYTHDPEHVWMREQFAEATASLPQG
jgi:DNA-binding transcriptional LysR family regulator